MSKILILTSETLLIEHAGVRRVAVFYATELMRLGREVSFGFYKNKKFYEFNSHEAQECLLSYKTNTRRSLQSFIETDPRIFTNVLIICPWLVDNDFPVLSNAIGIVLDLIPNLLATNELNFPGIYVDCINFANEHSVGYEYYDKYCTKIISISQQTTKDFLKAFPTSQHKILTILPFNKSVRRPNDRKKNQILMVNCFDPRKNFLLACKVLSQLSNKNSLQLVLVGKLRGNTKYLSKCFDLLKSADIKFTWLKNCSDKELDGLYETSALLFFPSIYEGLGLPILEAQDRYCPVVTAKQSSCGEVSFYPSYCYDFWNEKGFKDGIEHILNGENSISTAEIDKKWLELFKNYNVVSEIF